MNLSPVASTGISKQCDAVCAAQLLQVCDLDAVLGITQLLQELQRCLHAASGIHHSSGLCLEAG